MSKPNGYVLHEDTVRVVIATGFSTKSNNPKTGDMIQLWILLKAENPVQAVQTGKDSLICGSCPLRGVAGKQRACYVRLPNAPLGIWKAWKRGKYPKLEDYSVFAGRAVRFGAYGDPVFIPWRVVRAITAYARKWTGYTHQWRNPLFDGFKAFLMASTEDLAGTAQAQSQGWRTFRVSPALDPMAGEIICPNTTRGITCEACGLCAGTARQAKSIVIESHGNGRNYV